MANTDKMITETVLKDATEKILQTIADKIYDLVPYDSTEISEILEISDEEAMELVKILNDNIISNNKLWSSNKTNTEIQNAIIEANKYSDELIGGLVSISLEYVTTLPTTDIKSNVIYILQGTPNTLNVYNESTSSFVSVGNLDFDFSTIYTKTETDTLLADKADDNTVVHQDDVVSDMTTTSGTTVLSTSGLKTELDKKANDDEVVKTTDISKTINSTSTDDTVPTNKAVYDNVLKKCSNLGVITEDDFIISENTDLNSITTEGTYRCKAGSTCNTLINSPITGQAFKLIVNVGNSDFLAQYLVVSNTENFYPYVRTKHSLGTWGKWKKLCATSVPDVPETRITFSANTNYEEKATSIYSNYEVADGICYVLIYAKCLAPTNSWISINDSLPRPKRFVFKSLSALANATDSLNCTINMGGNMSLRGGTANGEYITTFSYHVAG